MPRPTPQYQGLRFGNLIVVKPDREIKGRLAWVCECDCGNTCVVVSTSLRTGNTKSCGCLRRKITSERFRTHGQSKTGDTYGIWLGIMARCYNKNRKAYKDYGGRGIKVCDRWHDFSNFYSDMGDRPSGYTLDRIRNNEDYGPTNCRWTSYDEQANNRRNTISLTVCGVTRTLSRWAKIMNVKYTTLWYRVSHGWEPEKALFWPTNPQLKDSELTTFRC